MLRTYVGIGFFFVDTNCSVEEMKEHSKEAKAVLNNYYKQTGQRYYEDGNYEKAISDFTSALELNPHDSSTYYERALARHKHMQSNNNDQTVSDNVRKLNK